MPKEVFENESKDYNSNTKDSADVTQATDDDKELKAQAFFDHFSSILQFAKSWLDEVA